MTWKDEAACRGTTDPEIFSDTTDPYPALAVWRECPVTAECFTWAKREGFIGIAGGSVFRHHGSHAPDRPHAPRRPRPPKRPEATT